MKKKMFSLLAVVLFAGSLINAKSQEEFETDCYEAWGTCDYIARGVAYSMDWSFEQEYNYFARCMDYYGCGG